ncbi:oxygenase MpaB family protein [Actinomadura sp. SCN-SB]|uniref:oxygenase MpaB family protein n=1 Tax=Actinomadura sp. SCN-SB TaxID=3373092 RepID=UPI0037528610
MTRTTPARWTREQFERLRHAGDPEVDEAAAAYLRDHPELGDARAAVGAVIRELGNAKRRARGGAAGPQRDATSILDELGGDRDLPGWAGDDAKIERGQRVFHDNGLYQAAVLYCACLPLAYAHESSAIVLAGVSDLGTRNLTRRVAETGQMLVDVMALRGPDTLRPGGPGHTSAVGLRVLHAFVRALVWERQRAGKWDPDWDGERHGAPVNQELLLATLIDFSGVTWRAMERFGVELSRADKEANLYTWSVFGNLMGVASCRERPLSLSDADEIMAYFSGTLGTCEEGRRLMAALLAGMESFMPLGWRKLPRSLIHWVFRDWGDGVERVPGLLAVPRPAWWSVPLFGLARFLRRHERIPDPVRPVIRMLMRKTGRCAILWFTDHFADGRAPFRIPPELARSWRIRRAGRIRRRTRRAVRGSLGRRPALSANAP